MKYEGEYKIEWDPKEVSNYSSAYSELMRKITKNFQTVINSLEFSQFNEIQYISTLLSINDNYNVIYFHLL